jgi:hypothetical protein
MASPSVPTGGPANIYGIEYQLLWSLFHATDWKVRIGSDHGITAILEPESGADLEYYFGEERRVEQIKARSTGKSWSFNQVVTKVLPSLYRCVDVKIPTAYVFVTESDMGQWREAYNFFQSLGTRPVPRPGEILSVLTTRRTLSVSGKPCSERSLFERVVKELGDRKAGEEEEQLRVWHLLRGFQFLAGQDYSSLVRKIDRALINHGVPAAEVETKRMSLVADLFKRARQGSGKLQSQGFFKSHGLSELSLKRWVDLQAKARRCMFGCLDTLLYNRDWDAREVSAGSSIFLKEPKQEDVTAPDSGSPLIDRCSAILFTGESGQGKSWRLYRLGHELAKEEQIAILIQGTGTVASDLSAAASAFCREIWGPSYVQSIQDLVDLVRRELPEVQQPWLTVLIDGVRDEEYALSLLRYPWQRLGLQVALGCRWSDSFTESNLYTIPVASFTPSELSRYLKTRLGVSWIDLPSDVRSHMTLPLFARLFCDLQAGDTTWRPVNEYQIFERAWGRQTARAPLAGAAIAALAARLPEEQVYPWPMARIWASGLRDREISGLVDSGLLRLAGGGRSLEIWHDRILNWAIAEGLVGALRSGEITVETLLARSIQGQGNDNPLRSRLGYVPMDTLWLLAAPEHGLGHAVRQFLTALEREWERRILVRNLRTLGARIVPYLFSRLQDLSTGEEE